MLGSKSSGVAAGDFLCAFVSQEACAGEGAERWPLLRVVYKMSMAYRGI